MNLLILVVDDEPDVELLFRQQFRHDIRAGRFTMEFAQSAPAALERITGAADVSIILILSDINMPGMSGLELLPKAKTARRSDHHDHRLWRCGDQAQSFGECTFHQTYRFRRASQRDRPADRARRLSDRSSGPCPLLAQSGHLFLHRTCPLLRVKRTFESSARTRHKFHLSQSPYCCVRSSPTQVGAQPGPVK